MNDAERQVMLLMALLCKRFDKFVEYAFVQLHPGKVFVPEDFLQAFCFALQNVVEGNERRLLVTMPRRHLKSFCAAVALPAFALGHDPSLKIGVASYSQELSAEHADLFRRLINSPWYQQLFPEFQLARRGDRNDNFRTTQHGGRRAVSVGGAFTGFGVNLLILDDLIKANDVNSSLNRETVERFYRETVLTRFDDPQSSKIISVQQRLHLDDIVSVLIETGRYRHLNLPAIADRDIELDLYDEDVWEWRVGELLSPERFPREELDQLRDEMGSRAFAAQFLLNPELAGGQLANWRRIRVVDEPLPDDHTVYVVQSVDTATGENEDSDYSVVTTWGYDDVKWRLMHVFRARLQFTDLKSNVIALARQWEADRVLVEDATIGRALHSELLRAGLSSKLWGVRGDKTERFAIALDEFYSGEIELWNGAEGYDELRREFRGFPSAPHDDIVDTISQFCAWKRRVWMPELIAIKYGVRPPRRPRPSNPTRRQAGL